MAARREPYLVAHHTRCDQVPFSFVIFVERPKAAFVPS